MLHFITLICIDRIIYMYCYIVHMSWIKLHLDHDLVVSNQNEVLCFQEERTWKWEQWPVLKGCSENWRQ